MKKLFYTGIPKLYTFLNYVILFPHLLSENGVVQNQQRNLAVNLSNQS